MRRSRWQDADDDGGCLKVMQGKGARANGFVPTTPSAAAPQLVQIVHARMLERLGCLRHPLSAWLWLGQTQTLSSALQHSLSHACGQKPGLVVDYAGNAAVKTPVASATAPADPPQRKTRWSAWLPSLKPRPERTSDAAALPNLAWVCMDPHFASAPRAGLAWLTQVVAPGGFLFFAAPGPGSLWALQDLYSAAGWGPAVPAWPDMPQWGQHLLQAGYLDPVLDVEHIALSYAPSTSSPGATPATPYYSCIAGRACDPRAATANACRLHVARPTSIRQKHSSPSLPRFAHPRMAGALASRTGYGGQPRV